MAAREIVVFMLSLACSIHVSAVGTYTVLPVDTESAVDATTVLLCTVVIDKSMGEQVYWHFEPNGANAENVATIGPFTNRNPSAFPRYKITGDQNRGIYNFEISETAKNDEGTYSCLIVKGSVTYMKLAMLTVRDNSVPPTAQAICNNGDLGNTHNEGDVVNLSCTISGGVPLPILQIVRDRETGVSNEVIQSWTSRSSDDVTETATFTISHIDHNAGYRCVTLHADKTEYAMGTFSCSFTVVPQVEFIPVVSITPPDVYIEGNDDNQVVLLTCEVIANPQAGAVQWEYEQSKLTTGAIDGNTLTFSGVSESYVGEIIKCSTTNSRGSGSASITFQETDDLLPFETYILFIIIAGGCLLFFFGTCICICCCCEKDNSTDDEKNLGYHVNDSRPTSMRQDNVHEDDIIDGYDADNFSGGSEANLVRDESKKSRASHKSRASQRSGISDRTDNRSSVRSNTYNDVNTFDNQAYSPDDNNDVEFNTPLY